MKQLRWWRKPIKHSDEAQQGQYFAALRKQAPHHSFPAVQHWVTRIAQDVRNKEQHYKMPLSPMKVFLNTYKTRLVVTSLIFAVTVVSCTTPVEQEETVGYMISGVIEGAQAQSAASLLSKLDWIQSGQLEMGLVASNELYEVKEDASYKASSTSSMDHRFVIALPRTPESQAKTWANDLTLIKGFKEVRVGPLQITSEKPVYKVILDSFWGNNAKIEILADQNLTNQAIETYVEKFDMYGVQVKQIQDSKGNMVLSLTPPEGISKAGLSTLKQFIGEVHSQSSSTEESPALILKKYDEVKAKLEQMETGPAREKMEVYKQQLEAKMNALKDAEQQ